MNFVPTFDTNQYFVSIAASRNPTSCAGSWRIKFKTGIFYLYIKGLIDNTDRATIDADIGAVDESAEVAGQQRHHRGDILGLAVTADRHLEDFLDGVLFQARRVVRPAPDGTDAADETAGGG